MLYSISLDMAGMIPSFKLPCPAVRQLSIAAEHSSVWFVYRQSLQRDQVSMNPVSPEIMMLVSLTLCSGGLLFVRSSVVTDSVHTLEPSTATMSIVFHMVMETYLHAPGISL